MNAAKEAVKKFTSKGGHHDTTYQEEVAPAVQHETVNRTQHEKATTAVDKEVHQDHYHTTEQPVKDSEILPEQHHHNIVPTQEKTFEHDDKARNERALTDQAAQYQNKRVDVEGDRTSAVEGVVAGEHVHHHVHETIQPVVQKQTVEPHVVHTTVPVHEVHHNSAKHHQASALPAVSMDDFKRQGGSLGGRGLVEERFDGCPPDVIAGANGGHDHKTTNSAIPSSGVSQSRGVDSGAYNSDSTSATNGVGSAKPEIANHGKGGPFNSHKHDPSLMDKINPKRDADGDGKAGIMD